MKIDDVYNYYSTWSNLARALGIGMNSYQYWRRKGYIPYTAQLRIEKESSGKLKARKEDAKPTIKKEIQKNGTNKRRRN